MVNVDDYKEVKDCIYKDEHYSVRDNGAVMRHQRAGMRKRKFDGVWSFGTPNAATGYLDFCGERVHRIVATAFHGQAPSEQHVVDHKDTNRQNNRPNNLRWLTKLENILNNEITRKKIELICGSVEAFLNDPQLLFGYETEDKNFSWMRNVSKEEAKNCLENWNNWARTASPNPEYKKEASHVGDWIYQKGASPMPTTPSKTMAFDSNKVSFSNPSDNNELNPTESHAIDTEEWLSQTFDQKEEVEEKREDEEVWYESATPSAKQDWWTKTEFPCCPNSVTVDGLKKYKENLKEGSVFSKNSYTTYYVIDSKIVKEKNILAVLSTNIEGENYTGSYSLAVVKIDKDKFGHISKRRFGNKETATHFYKLILGEEEWTEDDEIYWDT